MQNEQNISGSQNIAVQNVLSGASVNITQILNNSFQYNDLLDKIKDKQELYDLLPENNLKRRLTVSAELKQLQETLEQFKKDVSSLAESFNKIEINTDRLRRAKEYFDKGDIGESRAVLETELEKMQDEQSLLLEKKEHYEKNILPHLINNSEEFLLLALATQTDFDNPGHFNDACMYFENSIKSYASINNQLKYAEYLFHRNAREKVEEIYLNLFDNFYTQATLKEKADILDGLAIIHSTQHEFPDKFPQALEELKQTIEIYCTLTEKEPKDHLTHLTNLIYRRYIWHLRCFKENQTLLTAENMSKWIKEHEKHVNIVTKFIQNECVQNYVKILSQLVTGYSKFYIDKNKTIQYAVQLVAYFQQTEETKCGEQYYIESDREIFLETYELLNSLKLEPDEINRLVFKQMQLNEQNFPDKRP